MLHLSLTPDSSYSLSRGKSDFNMSRSTSTKSSSPSLDQNQMPYLDINASFSYGSSDEEDAVTPIKDRQSSMGIPKKHHKKKKIDGPATTITVSRSSSNVDSGGRSKFMPLSQKEKIKRAHRLLKQRQEPPVSPHLSLADLVHRSDVDGKNLYRDSWRSRSNRHNIINDDMNNTPSEERDQINERNDDNSSIFDCLLAAIQSGGGCGGGTSEAKTSVSSDENKCRDYNLCGDDTSTTSTVVSGRQDVSVGTPTTESITSVGDDISFIDKDSPQFIQDNFDSSSPISQCVTLEGCIDAIKNENWNLLLKLIKANPEILLQRSALHRFKNLLHILSGQQSNIPTTVLVTMINLCPESVSQTDQDGCLPLHHMAFTGGKDEFVKILLESWAEGTTVRNVDGDLPLHVCVWAGKGNEKVAKLLLEAYPESVGVNNNAAGTPVHLACCEKNASTAIVEAIIETQLKLDIPFNTFDNNGNTPLHVAIKTKAPKEVLETIHSLLGSEPFNIADRTQIYPLQMAMSINGVDPKIVKFICTASPKIMKKEMTNGMMPVCMAAEQEMPPSIIKELLLADSPVKFMPLLPQLRDVLLRVHSQSWWHLAMSGKYAFVIDDILSNMASIHEIVSLCQEPDLNGYSSLYEMAHFDVKNILRKNLIFCERYRVAPEYKATVAKGLLMLCAVEIPNDNIQTVNNTSVPYREVLLHCSVNGSDEHEELVQEMHAREKFEFSCLHSQQLYQIHTVSAKKIGCTGDMLCLAFERPLLTLQEIFETSRFRKRKNEQWARKSLNLLLSLARVLKYFHSVGYIHGSVEPSTIGKFQGSNNWKMLDMRSATRIGTKMRGDLRYGAPPESISISQKKNNISEVKKLVSFDENFVRATTSSQDSVGDNENFNSLEFNPNQCTAATSWDIWSFGLIMGQLVLGQSMVLLPNFEKASDAHLRNLHQYDDVACKRISDAARRVSGDDAANLLEKLLQPCPEDRPQSMDEVLSYSYFAVNGLPR